MTAFPRRSALVSIAATTVAIGACTAGVEPTVIPTLISSSAPAATDTVFVPSDVWGTRGGGAFELFSMGGRPTPTRLTYGAGSQVLGAAPSRERNRILLRRVNSDNNNDGRLDEFDTVSLLLVDLARQVEGPLLPAGWSTTSADWASDNETVVHTSTADGGPEDLWAMDSFGTDNRRLTTTPGVRERGGRVNSTVTRVVYERIDGAGAGKSEVWVFVSPTNLVRLTEGGAIGAQLPNTLYLVGSDAGPDYSPDDSNVTFRRLTSTSVAGGAWDILVVPATGGAPRVLASGPQFRSNPDWNKEGIVFAEQNLTTGGTDVVAIDPNTGVRRVLQSLATGFRASSPRWISNLAP